MTAPTDDHYRQADALLAQLDLPRKIGQMVQTERLLVGPAEVQERHLGSVLSGGGSTPGDNRPADWVAMNDAFWAASVAPVGGQDGIPLLYGLDAIHGNNNVLGATVFPHNIGLGAADDPELVRRIAQATAREILACGVEWTFAPTLAVAQDIHWGRTYESYGQDPALVERYATAFVEGMQGDLGADSVIACAKHWVGDGGTSFGVDQGDTAVSSEELDRTHIRPFRAALDAGVLTVMVSFNSWNGDKCHGHRQLVTDVLKGQLGFRGFVVSDWNGLDYLSEDYHEAVGMAINAGLDMVMVIEEWETFIASLTRHVEEGTVPMARIDDAVRRILAVKLAWGLFDRPRPAERPWSNHPSYGSTEHRAVAREAARKSLVLLKHEPQVLPLHPGARVLVAGKNSNNLGHQCGGFTVAWEGTHGNDMVEGGTTIWDGIRAVAPEAELSWDGSGADPARHDVAVVVVGEEPYAEGLGDIRDGDDVVVATGSRIRGSMKVLQPYGHTLELAERHPEDLAVIEHIAGLGIPVVVVLVSGRPLVVNRELEQAAAFIAAWLPGSEGAGVADVLFGEHDFQGRLSFAWPETERAGEPLFRIGHGLRLREA